MVLSPRMRFVTSGGQSATASSSKERSGGRSESSIHSVARRLAWAVCHQPCACIRMNRTDLSWKAGSDSGLTSSALGAALPVANHALQESFIVATSVANVLGQCARAPATPGVVMNCSPGNRASPADGAGTKSLELPVVLRLQHARPPLRQICTASDVACLTSHADGLSSKPDVAA